MSDKTWMVKGRRVIIRDCGDQCVIACPDEILYLRADDNGTWLTYPSYWSRTRAEAFLDQHADKLEPASEATRPPCNYCNGIESFRPCPYCHWNGDKPASEPSIEDIGQIDHEFTPEESADIARIRAAAENAANKPASDDDRRAAAAARLSDEQLALCSTLAEPMQPASEAGGELPDAPGVWWDRYDRAWCVQSSSHGLCGYPLDYQRHAQAMYYAPSAMPKNGWHRASPVSPEVERLKAELAEAKRERDVYHEANCSSVRVANNLKEQLTAANGEIERLRGLLLRLRGWDHMDTAADGSYWRSEIVAALAAPAPPRTPNPYIKRWDDERDKVTHLLLKVDGLEKQNARLQATLTELEAERDRWQEAASVRGEILVDVQDKVPLKEYEPGGIYDRIDAALLGDTLAPAPPRTFMGDGTPLPPGVWQMRYGDGSVGYYDDQRATYDGVTYTYVGPVPQEQSDG